MNTRIDYLYRDGSNYKAAGHAVLTGAADAGQIAAIMALMDCDFGSGPASFIPGQVGLEDLQGCFATATGQSVWDDEVDHPWHEVTGIETTDQPATVPMGVVEFLDRLRTVTWDPDYRPALASGPDAARLRGGDAVETVYLPGP